MENWGIALIMFAVYSQKNMSHRTAERMALLWFVAATVLLLFDVTGIFYE